MVSLESRAQQDDAAAVIAAWLRPVALLPEKFVTSRYHLPLRQLFMDNCAIVIGVTQAFWARAKAPFALPGTRFCVNGGLPTDGKKNPSD